MLYEGLFLALPTSEGETLKIAVFPLVAGAMFVLARMASSEVKPSSFSQSTPHTNVVLPEDTGISAAAQAESLEPLRITKFFFRAFDLVPGAPDPEMFADELIVELYNADTDQRWSVSYYVATPRGLAQLLKEKSWKYLYAPAILVVPRYNLEDIRRAVETRIREENELSAPGLGPSEESG